MGDVAPVSSTGQALVAEELAKQALRQVRQGLAVIDVALNKARSQLASQHVARVIDGQVEFEAIKPIHRGLAPRCDTGKDVKGGGKLGQRGGGIVYHRHDEKEPN